jgi:hypothetical protein
MQRIAEKTLLFTLCAVVTLVPVLRSGKRVLRVIESEHAR